MPIRWPLPVASDGQQRPATEGASAGW